MTLEERALDWIEPYWNAHHLVRTRDWVLELEPDAGEALRVAALTHDMERHFPGGPQLDMATHGRSDEAYNRAHPSARPRSSATGCAEEGADAALVAEVAPPDPRP